MATHEESARFLNEWERLTPEQQTLFLAAVIEMVEDLSRHSASRPSRRFKGVQGHPGIFELTWASAGRATFQYGTEKRLGEAHIIWRRIGSHAIVDDP
jgi:hypothetical protein